MQRFFAKYEFKAPHLLCCSDCEPMQMSELLTYADADAQSRQVSAVPCKPRHMHQLQACHPDFCMLPPACRWQNLRLAYTDTMGLPVSRLLCLLCSIPMACMACPNTRPQRRW